MACNSLPCKERTRDREAFKKNLRKGILDAEANGYTSFVIFKAKNTYGYCQANDTKRLTGKQVIKTHYLGC